MRQGLTVYPDSRELAKGAALFFIDSFNRAVAAKGFFGVVLSGGATPLLLYSLLSSEYKNDIDWKKAHLFWGDERCVPPDSAESNYGVARRSLISAIAIPPGNVHRIKGELDPHKAAAEYERELVSFFGLDGLTPPPFDLVLLGLGADGHTLSLFPGTQGLDEKERLVIANHVEKLKSWRVTLTFKAIENAKKTVFLISGADKAVVLNEALEGKDYPAGKVRGAEVVWLADSAAGALVKD